MIQHISVHVEGATGVQPIVDLFNAWAGALKAHCLPVTKPGSGSGVDYFRGAQQVLAFADRSTTPSLHLGSIGDARANHLAATVSGYLEPL